MTRSAAYILQLLLGDEDYMPLRDFFRASWNREAAFRYRVYLAQKAQNLNEIFFEEGYDLLVEDAPEEAERLKRLREETFLTQGGLLLRTEDLAQEYSATGAFPPILIVDEMCFSGRDFAELFYALEKRLQTCLCPDTDEEKNTLREALANAICFHAYMQDERGMLIEALLAKRVRAEKRVSQKDMHLFAVRLTAALSLSPSTANTAFFPTFYVSSADYDALCRARRNGSPEWREQTWRYRNKTTTIWRCKAIPEHAGLYCAVLARYNEFGEQYCLTPYILWHTIDTKPAEQLLNSVGGTFDGEGADQSIRSILLSDLSGLYGMRLKLLCSLTALLLAHDFLNTNRANAVTALGNDLDKIAQSFGTIRDVYPALERLNESSPRGAEARGRLAAALRQFADALPQTLNRESEAENPVSEGYLVYAERYFAQKQFDEQELLYRRRSENIPYLPWSAFHQMDNGVEQYLASGFPMEYSSRERKLDALLLLLQDGYITLNKLYTDPEESGAFYLKAGESTAILAYQHMYRFMPALIRLEDICRKNGLVSEDWAEQLGQFLVRRGADAELPTLFRDFLTRVHRCGLLLEDWMQFGILGIPIKNAVKEPVVFERLLLPKPEPSRHIRGVKEWNGRPWPEEERTHVAGLNPVRYVLWEQELQKAYTEAVPGLFTAGAECAQ